MPNKIFLLLVILIFIEAIVAPPVDQKKKEEEKDEKKEELDDFGLEYGRYLQQVVQALEEDKEFAKKLENISADQIRSGHIAKELEFVKHNVRSKLDELKRIEVDRLRKLIQEQMERTELGLYRDNDGHVRDLPGSMDGRRWRTIKNQGLNRKEVKIPKHLDIENPHSFEIADLKKLIQTATDDLEELDKKRREEFKQYELEKEAVYRESLTNMTDDQRKEAVKHHEEIEKKHKDHPKVSHPGSKPQLEQVWEEQDHMPKEEFNPKTFFAMHDINGDGHLDVDEVEAILIPEVKKMYNPNNEEDDPAEMAEEFHRMREHIFNETDKNKDHLISLEEFLKMTEQQEFQRDEGWKGLDEQQVYNEAELEEYMRQKHMQYYPQGQYYGDPRNYYDVGQGVPPGYQGQQFQQGHPQQFQQGHPQQFQQGHQQQFQQGHPQQGNPQQFQGHPQQFPQGHPQQFQQGHPQQFQQGHPQQFQQGHPQQFQQGHPQQIQQGHPQQIQQGHPQQIQQGHPQQIQQGHPQQIQQGHPQQIQQGHPQQIQQGHPQQFQQVNPQQGHPQVQQGNQQQFQQVNSQQGNPQQVQKPQQPAGSETAAKPLHSVGQDNMIKSEQKQSNSINEVPPSASKISPGQDSAAGQKP